MPTYVYTDKLGHDTEITHRMFYSTGVICSTCDADMWRRPQAISVVWGGLSPSQGELSPEIKNHISTLDQQRDEFKKIHEEHEKEGE